MKIFFLPSVLATLVMVHAHSQNIFPSTGSAGIGTTTPNASSALEIVSTTQGLLAPRMTKTQRDAISSPSTGLLIYQTNSTPGFYYYSGSAWTAISTKGANTALSNLKAPTAVNVDLLPGVDNTINLGSGTLRLKDVNLFNLKFSDGTTQTTAFTKTAGGDLAGTYPNPTIVNNAVTSAKILDGTIVNADISGGAAIAYPKLSLVNSIVNADINAAAGIVYTKLALGNSIVDADINAAAGIVYTKLALGNSIVNGDINNAAGIVYTKLNLANSIVNGDIKATAAIAYSKLALANKILTGDIVDGTITSADLNNSGVTAGTYGSSSLVPVITVNAQGRVTAAATMGFSGFANDTLSNLAATAINQSLIPKDNGTLDLGSSSNGWNHLYLTGNIYEDGIHFISSDPMDNTWLGLGTGLLNTTGANNTATGFFALSNNSSGTDNTANGRLALFSNTAGSFNSATGSSALSSNTSGNWNTADGNVALTSNSSGYSNVGIGAFSLNSNTSGHNLVAVGDSALYSSTSASAKENTAIGNKALFADAIGASNTAVGYDALYSNTSGTYNTAIGDQSLYTNTSSSHNTATGYVSMFFNTGTINVADGDYALFANTTGSQNTAVGSSAMSSNTIGFGNTSIGNNALFTNTTGTFNTALGANADVMSPMFTDATALGDFAIVNAPHKIRFGSSAVMVIEGNVPYTVSDGRFKNNVTEDVKGLEFINKLRPVIYNFEAKKFDEFLHKNNSAQFAAQEKNIDYQPAERIRNSGFIAQEVEQAAKEVNYDFSGVHIPENGDDNYSLAYGEFVVPLVKAVQELSSENEELKNRLAKLEEILGVNDQGNNSGNQKQEIILEGSKTEWLGQNIPNPFQGKTTIPYSLPANVASASIVFENAQGVILKTVEVKSGTGSIEVATRDLSAGSYHYSLIIDGKVVDTKQMTLIK